MNINQVYFIIVLTIVATLLQLKLQPHSMNNIIVFIAGVLPILFVSLVTCETDVHFTLYWHFPDDGNLSSKHVGRPKGIYNLLFYHMHMLVRVNGYTHNGRNE